MSYTALYRKYRPDTFDDVKGQEHIVTALRNQIKSERVGHAYLFCGTRGTGKTTIAKILAKAVNCEHSENGNPCNKCETCLAIQRQASMNVIEIDAASNNGVDNIREIVEEVRYSPTSGKYKVYIIDEVHMLSAGAFNALLKTLEEPPSYVIFILATTEVQKIPVTILSRCQRYDFKRITVETITERLKELVEAEHVEAEDKALKYIARMADGAIRDALSILDQCLAFYFGQKLTYDAVLSVLGAVDVEVFARLLRYVEKGSVADCILLLDEIVTSGRELTQFVTDYIWYLRNLLLLKASSDTADMLGLSSDQTELLEQEAKCIDGEQLMRYIRIFSELSNKLRYATQKRVLIEIALVKLCCPSMESDTASLSERIRNIEIALENGTVLQSRVSEEKEEESEQEETPTEIVRAVGDDLKAVAAQWQQIMSKLSPLVRIAMISARVTVGQNDELMLMFEDSFKMDSVAREGHMEALKAAIIKVTGKDVAIKLGVIDADNKKMSDYPDITKIFKDIPIQYVD